MELEPPIKKLKGDDEKAEVETLEQVPEELQEVQVQEEATNGVGSEAPEETKPAETKAEQVQEAEVESLKQVQEEARIYEIIDANLDVESEAPEETKPVETKAEQVQEERNGVQNEAPEGTKPAVTKAESKLSVKEEKLVDVRSRNCPYLDTINRHFLDFDFEKLCSVSLSHLNVYACLVCGKYFQGRGQKSHAYTHSVQCGHHVYINLHTLKFYCLPDNYEVIDSALDDIKYVLNPTFKKEQIPRLDRNEKMSRAYDGTLYLPGIVGLNNIKANDYCNVVLQALSNVPPIRDYFLRRENYKNVKRPPGDTMILLVQRFGELLRKLWNPKNFKAHVSPHEMLQAVVLCSKKRLQITEQGDPVDFLSWLLNSLHMTLGGTKKLDSSIIYKTFQGSMKVYTKKIPPIDATDAEKMQLMRTSDYQVKETESPFLFLTLDLPPPPLFKDDVEENIIPQVSLFSIMSKFDGVSEKEYKTYRDSTLKSFELLKLPPYLIVCIKRFTKNTFFVEKNPTIVNFPVSQIDLREYLSADSKVQMDHPHTTYDLLANIVHDGQPGPDKGTYRVHVLHSGTGQWYEMQDLHVRDILPQMITLSESYLQIYKLNTDSQNGNASMS